MGCKKQGAKKQGHCYSKREEAAWPLLFFNNNDPVFLPPAFCNSYFGPFLKVPDPKKIQADLKNQNSGRVSFTSLNFLPLFIWRNIPGSKKSFVDLHKYLCITWQISLFVRKENILQMNWKISSALQQNSYSNRKTDDFSN